MTDQSPAPAGVGAPENTRDRLVEAISVDGPIAAGDLAERFGLTGAAIRRHLAQLEADGVIEEREPATVKRGRGRPRREFVLASSTPRDLASSEADEIAIAAMRELEAAGGAEAVVRLARARTDRWEREFARRLTAEQADGAEVTTARRLEIVVDLLQERGYAASMRPVAVRLPGGGRTLRTVQLCQGRCPIQDIAAEHPELCDVETSALARMLGAPVQRLATRASGAHVCTTHVTPMPGGGDELPDHELFTEGRTP
ncbi:winged helix-turn-helix transcriptional regulator [Helcobacillus massiliensis]|uniref:Putative ArsR family transcriptional regulator n=1 Tax=Helcobacillus massiliensis TaxID=521392 RepID=A0A839QWE1_9MICO|nr:winged helix-turn-helix transcriptional regulator [Helcobacillus massiliensis]MBB3022311.1 putative ArsR family transcriptional regulator [Helcobacillus massiliensis]MCT1556951.1 winged helix-turn-helix transcriptional regulator [Helcobacillus massiliensis]MCT2035340.1 winged helix-turn-helix transcriptional regulator [Helcobacillus massiliensis]MCT2331445.1 winged helix-turn-helix transcriptional regulator [Helcobacillus massiliensis]